MFHAAKYGIPRDTTKGMFLIRPGFSPHYGKRHDDEPTRLRQLFTCFFAKIRHLTRYYT